MIENDPKPPNRYVDQSGVGISGAEVTFTIISGPNANLRPAVFFTDGNGNSSWAYTGAGGTGQDIIQAVVTTPSGCDPSARATANRSSQMVTITRPTLMQRSRPVWTPARFRELRARAEKELGPRLDIREFHARVLESGCVPLRIIEQKIDRWIEAKRSSG